MSDSLKGYAFLFWAYNVVWIGLAVYVVSLVLRLRRLDRRLDGLERELRGRTGSAASRPPSAS